MAPTTRSMRMSVDVTSTSAEDSQGSTHMSNNCAIALALLLIATGMLALLARVYSPSSPSPSSSATFFFSPGPSVVPPSPSLPTQQSPPGYPQGTLRVAGGYYMIESGSCGGGAILTTSECDAAATALGLPDKTSTDIKHHIMRTLAAESTGSHCGGTALLSDRRAWALELGADEILVMMALLPAAPGRTRPCAGWKKA